MALDVVGAVKAGGAVYSILEKTGYLDSVLELLRLKKSTDVLLLGVSGAGKSTFRDEIFGIEGSISRFQRTTQTETKKGKVENTLIKIIDTPGQSTDVYKKERGEAIIAAARSKRLGIINVVSYGYHEGIIDKKEAVANGVPREDYLNNRRKEEEDQLSEWVEILGGKGGSAQWVINLVTKGDLWWKPEPEVEQSVLKTYIEGSFFEKLGPVRTNKYQVMPYSGEYKPFYGEAPMSGYYGESMKHEHHNNLVAKILILCAQMTDLN